MSAQLLKASHQYKEVVKNLMQFYVYDFSEFINLDVEADGLFAAYSNLNDYWENNNMFPYLIQKDGKHIGFVLVRFIETVQRNYFSITEFFVMKKCRREGIGKTIAHQIFNLYKGEWEVYQKESNKPAQLFWNKVIDDYTKGDFTELFENGRIIQDFKS